MSEQANKRSRHQYESMVDSVIEFLSIKHQKLSQPEIKLPDDILFELLSYLSNDGSFLINSCALVSKHWLEIIKQRCNISIKVLGNNLALLETSQFRNCISKAIIQDVKENWSKVKELSNNLTVLDLRGAIICKEGAELIGQLNNLKELYLVGCNVENEEINTISMMDQLNVLKIKKNGYSKLLVQLVAQPISKMTQLTKLGINRNLLDSSSPESISKMTQLTELNISSCELTSHHAELLSNLNQLTWLNISKNQKLKSEGAKHISKLTQLKTLKINNCGIENEGAIAIGNNLKQLTLLSVRLNEIGEEGAKAIGQLAQLTSLNISVNMVRTEGVKSLCELTQLTELFIVRNGIQDEGVIEICGQLSKLKKLCMGFNEITSEGLRNIGQLSQLRTLTLDSNKITPEGIQFISNLSQLTFLDLDSNHVSDLGAQAISSLKNLQILKLNFCKITPNGIFYICQNCKELKDLSLFGNLLGTFGVFPILFLKNQLTSLKIGSNQIRCEGLEILCEMISLKHLSVVNNQISSESSVRMIEKLVNLKSLNIMCNPIGQEGNRIIREICRRNTKLSTNSTFNGKLN